MAGMLQTIAKRLFGSRTVRKQTPTPVRAVYHPIARVKHVAPVVGPDSIVNTSEDKNVGKDDYLLNQIDEFRDKAQQLQDLLLSKESKVMELQNIVDEREGKAKELESILTERQKQADGIAEDMAKEVTAEITSQIDVIIERVTSKIDELSVTIGKDLGDGQKLTEQQYAELKATLDETLPSLNTQLDTLKSDLSEKVHSENVKCYRNVSDLIKPLEDKLELLKNTEQNIEYKANAIKKSTTALMVLTIINLLGIVAVALLELDIFRLF